MSSSGEEVAKVWIKRAAGGATVATFIFGFLAAFDGGLEEIPTIVFGSLAVGLTILFLGEVIRMVLTSALEMGGERKNPFVQGVVFVLAIFTLVALLDLLVMRGTFVVVPVMTLAFTGSFGESYWGCQGEWVSVEEGSFCGR